MKNIYAIDVGAFKIAVCYASIPQPLDQINGLFLKEQVCDEIAVRTGSKEQRVSFPCVPGGLRSFWGGNDLIQTGTGAFLANSIITELLRDMWVSLEKDRSDTQNFANASWVDESFTTIGYPFGWNELRKNAYLKVVEQAGFPNVSLVDEASAFLAYFERYHREEFSGQKGILVYDLGSASLSIAIAEILSDGKAKKLTVTGNPSLGGCVFDKQVESLILEKLNASILENVVKRSLPMEEEVLSFAKKLKEHLSNAVANGLSEVTETLQFDGWDLQISISRSEFELLSENIVPELVEPVWEALSKAYLQPEDIGTIFFVGSAARLWCVHERVVSLFPNAKIVWSENPQETLVKGLALHAIARDMARQHLLMGREKERKGVSIQENVPENLRPVRSPFRNRILVGAAFLVVLFVAMGWFFSDHFDIAGLFYRSKAEVQEKKDDASSGESTVQDEKKVPNVVQETPEDLSKEVQLPQISAPDELQIICVLNGTAEDSDFYQGVLFAKERLGVASVRVLRRNDLDILCRDESFAHRVAVGSKENLDALPKEEHDGVFLFPLWEDAYVITVPEFGVRDVMKVENIELILFWGFRGKNSEMDIENPKSSKDVISSVATKQISIDQNADLLGGIGAFEDFFHRAKKLLSAIKQPYHDGFTQYDNPIYGLVERGELKIALLEFPPQKVDKLPDTSHIHMIIPPFEWHRGFWSVVLLLQQERLDGEKTVRNLSDFLNSTLTILTKHNVVLYKRHGDTQELQEIQRFPIIGWR